MFIGASKKERDDERWCIFPHLTFYSVRLCAMSMTHTFFAAAIFEFPKIFKTLKTRHLRQESMHERMHESGHFINASMDNIQERSGPAGRSSS